MATLSELAAKARRDPYEFDPEDGQGPVLIAQPTWETWAKAGKVLTRDDDMVQFLTGLGVSAADAARIDAAMNGAPLGTGDAFMAGLRGAFGLGN